MNLKDIYRPIFYWVRVKSCSFLELAMRNAFVIMQKRINIIVTRLLFSEIKKFLQNFLTQVWVTLKIILLIEEG